MRRAAATLALAGLLLAPACARKGDPARAALDGIVAAAEKRDADGVLVHLATDYKDAGGWDRNEAGLNVRRYFAAYESLGVRISDVSIERAPGMARATFRAQLSGAPRRVGGLEAFFPRVSAWRFEVRLAPEGDRWKVYSASWARAD